MIQIEKSDHVVAVYDLEKYISRPYFSKIMDLDEGDVHITFMKPHVDEATQNFYWPDRKDKIWIAMKCCA